MILYPNFKLFNELFNEVFDCEGELKTDIYEDEKTYYVEMEVPGVKKDAINVKLDNGNLVVDVKAMEREANDYTYYEKSRTPFQFTRKYKLPNGVEETNIKVKLEDGVLTITIMKPEKMLPKAIMIE